MTLSVALALAGICSEQFLWHSVLHTRRRQSRRPAAISMFSHPAVRLPRRRVQWCLPMSSARISQPAARMRSTRGRTLGEMRCGQRVYEVMRVAQLFVCELPSTFSSCRVVSLSALRPLFDVFAVCFSGTHAQRSLLSIAHRLVNFCAGERGSLIAWCFATCERAGAHASSNRTPNRQHTLQHDHFSMRAVYMSV